MVNLRLGFTLVDTLQGKTRLLHRYNGDYCRYRCRPGRWLLQDIR